MIKKYANIIKEIFLKFKDPKDLYYIVESANWSIKEDGINIVSNLKIFSGEVCENSRFIKKKAIIHYGSMNVFLAEKHISNKKHKIIVTCFHLVDGDDRNYKLIELDQYVSIWHTSCEITKKKLMLLGIDEKKIKIIPLGIDLTAFYPVNELEKINLRKELKIDESQTAIGSFQKDGNGWGEGLEPKLIKGPDILCNIFEKILDKYNLFAVLSGPARGYVKKRLDSAKIPYYHHHFEIASDVADLYRVIDYYLVTSREEGGPKAILESMASGVPIISTNVGMASEIIQNGLNGFIVDIEDENQIIKYLELLIDDDDYRKTIIKNGRTTALSYELKKIAQRYENELYS